MWRIKDWELIFENSRSRACERLNWVPIPNKHDSDGYAILIDHEHGASHYGTWCLLVQVASKCRPRGTLIRVGGAPHDADSLSRITRVGAHVFREAIPRFLEVGWLETISEPSADYQPPVTEGKVREGKGREGKGREWKGMEGKNRTFVRTEDEVFCFAAEAAELQTTILDIARKVAKKIYPHGCSLRSQDQDEIVMACYLSEVAMTADWLHSAVDSTSIKKAERPMAYFRGCLRKGAEKLGYDYHALVERVVLPKRAKEEASP
jgi:hypothetical protein